MMERALHSGKIVQSTLRTLPVEVLVYIFSFLSTCDIVRIRCVSKTLRSVGEIPSLWENFMWPRYAPRDDILLKSVLKMVGKHIKRFHLAHHIAPAKLQVMLKFCKNVVHLSLPSFNYKDVEKLEKIVHSMGCVQILDFLVPVSIFLKFKEDAFIRQCFMLSYNLKELSLHFEQSTIWFSISMQKWFEEWANSNYVPRKLNIIVDRTLIMEDDPFMHSLQLCVPILGNKTLQKSLESKDTAWVNIFFKTLADFSLTIPFIQLQVTDSSVVLSSVRASKYGILGLDDDALHLTEGSYRGKKVHKALLTGTNNEYIDTSVTSLSSATYFDASYCKVLHPGHLEQLSIACPNLQRLDLTRNSDCLNNLQGLRSLADNCKSLQGLSLREIHMHHSEHGCIQLWEILCTMHLTHLAIEMCMINIYGSRGGMLLASAARDCNAGVKREKLIHMFQRYSSLQVLEVGTQQAEQQLQTYESYACYIPSDNELLLLTNFPSITYYMLCSLPSNNCRLTLKRIFGQKYLRRLFLSKTVSGKLSLSLEGHCSSLQQLYIHSLDTVPTETFIDAVCSHGGLEHVILFFKSLTAESIEKMIEHSFNLVTFRVYLDSYEALTSIVTATIKTRFSKRKLFNGGSFDIQLSFANTELNKGTNLLSMWDSITTVT